VIGLDTNVLARYCIEDACDAQAIKQRAAARRLLESGKPLMICKTVLLEFEWVMRGYYGFSQAQIAAVMNHLSASPHIMVEDKECVVQALSNCEAGLELADALHHVSYRGCDNVASFDDMKFARRAQRMGLSPKVTVRR
jgi:predicted nucleic-acid-binding protein